MPREKLVYVWDEIVVGVRDPGDVIEVLPARWAAVPVAGNDRTSASRRYPTVLSHLTE